MTTRVKAEKRLHNSPNELPEKKLKKKRRESGASRKVQLEIDGTKKTLENLELSNEHVVKCVDAILKLAENNSKKTSLLSEDEKIFLQINNIKIPKLPRRYLRIFLPHTMVGPNDDVALIVPDIAKGKRQDYEKTVDHWETILQQKGVTQIKDIIPMNKIKTEYSQYEMQRKLARLYDFFLVDGRIAGHTSHLLGGAFKRFAIPPVPIKPQRGDLKDEIATGLRKASLRIHGNGNSHSVRVATSSMPKQSIVDNIIATCEEIKKSYPGGWNNIRSILVKTGTSLAVPIYYSIKNKNQVETTKVAPKRPKAFKTVEGELSTIGATVKLTPGGYVKIEGTTLSEDMETEMQNENAMDGTNTIEETKEVVKPMKKEQKVDENVKTAETKMEQVKKIKVKKNKVNNAEVKVKRAKELKAKKTNNVQNIKNENTEDIKPKAVKVKKNEKLQVKMENIKNVLTKTKKNNEIKVKKEKKKKIL